MKYTKGTKVRHKTKGMVETVVGECKVKYMGVWVDGVIYKGNDTNTGLLMTFVRTKEDFENNFEVISAICTSLNKRGGVIKHHKIYALKGNELYEFNSVPEAAEKTGCCKDKIYKCCNGKLAYTGGYIWSYKPLDIPTEVEEWRDVKGYENLYQVSRKGRVRSSHKGYWEILTSGVNWYGYNQYLFHKDGKKKNMRGSRLVAEAYIPNPDNLPYVKHKDENPANDCVDNLEWCYSKV